MPSLPITVHKGLYFDQSTLITEITPLADFYKNNKPDYI